MNQAVAWAVTADCPFQRDSSRRVVAFPCGRDLLPCRLPRACIEASDSTQRIPQDELDLAIETAQIVASPALKRLQHVRIDPQEKRFPWRHMWVPSYVALLVNGSGVHHRLN